MREAVDEDRWRLFPGAPRERALALLFPLLAMALFPRALLGSETFFHYDTWMQNLTFRAWWFEQLKAGHFATWCPGIFAGYPLFAETQTGPLYPPTFVLFLLLPPTLAFSLSVIFHFAFAGVGAYALARNCGIGLAGSVLCGLAFELSGFLVTHVVHFNLLVGAAWAPWILLFGLAAYRGSGSGVLLLAIGFACLVLGAHPYATLMAILLLVVALGIRALGGVSSFARSFGALALAGALGLTLSAVQLLPTWEFLSGTTRAEASDYEFLTFGSYPPWHVPSLVAPDLFGTPVDGSYHAGPDWSHFAETCAHVGTVTLALAVVAIVLRRDRVTSLFTATSALAFLLMLGKYTPLYRVVGEIPVLQSTRLPARFSLLFTLGIVALAGLGLDALLREASARRRRIAVGGGALVLVGLGAAAWIAGAEARNPDDVLRETGRLWPAVMTKIEASAASTSERLLVVLVASIASMAPFCRRKVGSAFAVFPLVVVGVELFTWSASFNPLVSNETLLEPPPVVRQLPRSEPRPRIFRQGVDEFWSRSPGQPRTDLYTPEWKGNSNTYYSGAWALPPNSQLLYGVDSGEGFTSLLPHQWLDWMGLAAQPGATPRPDLSEAQADLLSLDAVVSSGSGIAGDGWEPTPLPGDLWVSRNRNPLPRVRLARSWRTERREEILRLVRDASHDPRKAVLLEAPPPGLEARREGGAVDEPVRGVERGPGRWDLEFAAGTGAIVVVSESFDEGWRASTESGTTLPIFRADGLFVAFVAPERGGRVHLRHVPGSLRLGMIVSLGALLALVVAIRRFGRGGLSTALVTDGRDGRPWLSPSIAVIAGVVTLVSGMLDVGGWRGDRMDSKLSAAASRAWMGEAQAAYAAGALEAAADLLLRATRVHDSALAYYRLAVVERERGRLDEMRRALESALRADPDHIPARELLDSLSSSRSPSSR